ncbi:flagellin N-terminal helical domain-containing protein [Polaromonas sp. AET17H-212]|uniref:flagellin N-terminal helical domain-containing protein n=1 Tax=Polaromonas sp. AET17H-212 TaxID=1977061 RepID=UPI000BBBEBE3|nr:flagellin [Polaromonas sp. AET17H-212]
MAAVINTNIASLNAQRNLNTSQSQLATSLQRLSSGLRINSAKDDAAGLAISEKMSTQIRGLNQASRNANDGISLAQTAEGALSEVTNNLQRIRELAVQSANATNNAADRAALDQEVQQRIAEIDRISSQTSFNGTRVLDGSFGTAAFQVGANAGETISVNLSSGVKANQMGQISTAAGAVVTNSASAAGAFTIQVGNGNAVAVGASSSFAGVGANAGATTAMDGTSAFAKLAAINASGVSGVTASASNSVTETVAFSTVTNGTGAPAYTLVVNGTTVINNTTASAVITADTVVSAINANSATTGVSATKDATTGKITMSSVDARNITVSETVTAGTGGTGTGLNTNIAADNVGTATTSLGSITLKSTSALTLAGADVAKFGFAAQTYAVDSTTLTSVNVLSVNGAVDAMSRLDAALNSVSTLRSTFGAIQSRFESTIANLQTTAENLTGARSRILDTDFAAETANLTRGQILQQAGTAMLAQANSLPNGVLALLRG